MLPGCSQSTLCGVDQLPWNSQLKAVAFSCGLELAIPKASHRTMLIQLSCYF